MEKETVNLYNDPNKYAEKPTLKLNELSIVGGYQKYFISQNHIEVNPDDKKLLIKKNLAFNLFNTIWFRNKSVLDIGANGGFFSFYALLKGAKNVSSLDLDTNYINIIKQIKNYYNFRNIEIFPDNLISYNKPNDLVFAFALIHWIYSCTADFGSLDKAIEKLAELTNDILIIEWIEPSDEAIQFFKHIEFNQEIISADYTRELFEEALKKYFFAFKKIAKISDTREVYIAIKRNEIIEQLNKFNSNINLWELFSLLNENEINYTFLKNKELIGDNYDKFGDSTCELLIEKKGIDLINSFLSSDIYFYDNKQIIYHIPIANSNQELALKCIIQNSEYLNKIFENRIITNRIRYKYLYILANQDEKDYLYYKLLYHLGAVPNSYLNILGNGTTNFKSIFGELAKIGLTENNYNANLENYSLEYLYSPENLIYSRILDKIDGKYYISRIYKIDDKIIKQASSVIGKREYSFLSRFNSDYFPKVSNSIEAKNYFAFEEEYINGFLLSDKDKFHKDFQTNDFLEFVRCLLDILNELFNHKIIHRDILKENIIVKNKKPVLIDFGWAIEKGEDFITPQGLGKGNVLSDGVHNDIYSMGLIIKELDKKYNLMNELVSAMTEKDDIDYSNGIQSLYEILDNIRDRKSNNNMVSIIIPAHNNLDLTKKCIKSIYKFTDERKFEIIAVDNASNDGTLDFFNYLSNKYSNFKFIGNEENLSFSKANNQAIKESKGNYILLLNNDTRVSENWLDILINEAEKENASIVGTLLLYPDSTKIQHCGVRLGLFDGKKMFYHIHRLRKLEYVEEAKQSKDMDYVSAACMLIDKRTFEKIGYFDEEFINGFEDIDFCIRAKKSGLKIRYCGNSLIYHYESQTEGRDKFDEENYKRLIDKWDNILIPSETEQESVANLTDMWLREDLIKDPDDIDKINELLEIAKLRNNALEIKELENLLKNQDIDYSDSKKVSIIIPVFNNIEFTKKCINSIYQNTTADFELIIVDNNSSDGTAEYLNSLSMEHNELIIITNDSNLGFAKATNQGAKQAIGKYLLFLNNDTEVKKDWLSAMLASIESDTRIGIVGSKLIYPDNKIQHCGIEFQREKGTYILWSQHRFRNYDKDAPEVNQVEEVDAVTGACLLISKELFNSVGGFDESYKMYFEDTDLCFKVRSAGYKIVYEPKSEIIHYESQTIKEQSVINELNIESAKIFYKKWAKEIAQLELNTYIEKEEDNFIYLSKEIFPNLDDKNALEHFYSLFLMLPPFYLHVGGIGDALLLLSTFYDDEPNQIVFSLTRNRNALQNLFSEFDKLKKVYFFDWDQNIQIELFLRGLFPKMNNFLGMGATPEHWNNEIEWNQSLNIYEKYHIKNKPEWAKKYINDKITNPQIVLAPMGSLKGMPDWKRNWIKPQYWKKILEFLKEQDIKPIIIGTKEENRYFPIAENSIDKRSYSFKEQMRIIASADICITADSWHKTFAALSGTPTIVFQSERSDNAVNMQDSSEYVFIYPWEELKLVKNIDEFVSEFQNLKGIGRKNITKPAVKTSYSKDFWRQSYEKIKSVLIKCPRAIGDALTLTALVSDLKKQFPHLIISVSGDENARDVFKGHKDVDGFILTDTEEEFAAEQISDKVIDYNIIISKMPEYYNKIEYMDIIGNIAGLKFNNRSIVYEVDDEETNRAKNGLSIFDNSSAVIGLHLLTNKDIKRCYPYGEDLIGELLNSDKNLRFVYFGKEKLKQEFAEVYDCADLNVDLRNQIALASMCDAFLTIDSAFFHIGHNLFDKPTMVLCGATNPELIGNQNKEFFYLRNEELNCLNCYWQTKCSIECMYNLSADFVAKEFDKIIRKFVINKGAKWETD